MLWLPLGNGRGRSVRGSSLCQGCWSEWCCPPVSCNGAAGGNLCVPGVSLCEIM